MIALIDWILNLFRKEDAARAFVAAPEQAMRDAGLSAVTAAQLSSVAATAVPGLMFADGDPIAGLQRAVANQYGLEAPVYQSGLESVLAPALGYSPSFGPSYAPAPTFAPSPAFAPETTTDLASRNTTDLASHNDTSLLSPRQDAGANAQQGSFNLGFGDITFGRKNINTATDGGVVVGRDNAADIVSGDGAVLGNANRVSHAGGDAITTEASGSVIKGASLGGSQTTTSIDGAGNTTTADGHQATLTTTSTTTAVTRTTTTDSSDNSLHETTLTDASTHDYSDHTLFDAGHNTTNSTLDTSHDMVVGF